MKLSATDEKTEKKLFNSPTHSITETDKFRVNFRINIYGNIYDIDFYSIERIFIRTEMLC